MFKSLLRSPFLLIFTLIAPSHAGESSRPMSEMQGGCENYQWNMTIEFEAWERNARPLASSAALDPALTARPIPLAEKVRVTLHPTEKVVAVLKPGKSPKGKARTYGGIIPFQVAKDGIYRISAGSRAWYDVAELPDRKRIDSLGFEMQTGCSKILKSVSFPLQVETRYLLQISGSPHAEIDLLLTPEKLK